VRPLHFCAAWTLGVFNVVGKYPVDDVVVSDGIRGFIGIVRTYVGSRGCRSGEVTLCREDMDNVARSGRSVDSLDASFDHGGSILEDPGDPERLPPPFRSLPGVMAPDWGDNGKSSKLDERRLGPGVCDWEGRRLSSEGNKTSSWRLEGRASGSNASSSSTGTGEKRDFSPKWVAGTDDEMGGTRGRLNWITRDDDGGGFGSK
jgi:hypothetical protein